MEPFRKNHIDIQLLCNDETPHSYVCALWFLKQLDVYFILFDGWVVDACQLFDDIGWVADATSARPFIKWFCSGAIRSKYLAHAQPNPHEMLPQHPTFHDIALSTPNLILLMIIGFTNRQLSSTCNQHIM